VSRSILVVSGGLRQPSSTRLLADRLADATVSALREQGEEADVETVEVRDHAHDLTNNLLTGFASGALEAVKGRVAGADGLIAVSPIFSASYSGLFKTFFDVLGEGAIAGVPVLLAATAGTARHSLALEHALRPLFTYLKAVTVPTAVFAASEDWGAGGEIGGGLSRRVDRAAGELAMLVAGAPPREVRDPYDDPVPFEQLLQGGGA
jgi:FMN reductase